MKAIGRFIRTVLILAILVVGGAIAYALSGHYDVSVGTGHTAVTKWYLDTVRERSIERRAAEISVPDLDDLDMIEAGAVTFDQACAGCHGRPGRDPSDSFDPRPPALTRGQPDPAAAFWVTRNGIKMSAMPARSEERMSDEDIWNVIAFLQTASTLTEGEYREMVEPPPEPEPAEEPEADAEADAEMGDETADDDAETDDESGEDNEPAGEDDEPEADGDTGAG